MKGSQGNIVINGQSYTGHSVTLNRDNIIIDGVVQSGSLIGNINIEVLGDVEHIDSGSGNVKANSVGIIQTGSGNVTCEDVSGSIRTGSGDVQCLAVSGSVRTGSGDVYCCE